MIWTPRVTAHNYDGIWTWDAPAPNTGVFSVVASQDYVGVQDMLAGVVAFTGSGFAYVQGNGAGSAATVNASSFTITFPAATTAGNAIVVDVFMLNVNADTFGVTDNKGNTYTRVFEQHTGAFFGGDVWATFVSTGISAGASHTVTVTALPPTNPNDISDWVVAIHEYSGFDALPVDGFGFDDVLAQNNSSMVSAPVTTSGPDELLHAFVVTHQFNAGTVSISTISNVAENSSLGPPPIASPVLDDSPDETGIPFQNRVAQTGNPAGRIFSTSWLQWLNKLYATLAGFSPSNPVVIPQFQTNGVANAIQTVLNLIAGTNITLTPGVAGDVTIASTATAGGGAVVKTADYTAVGGDSGKQLVFNKATAITLTLPAAAPSATWNIQIQNIGAGELTVNRNSLTIDGVAANLTVAQFQGFYITTDGTNYFTSRGGPIPGTTITDSVVALMLKLASSKAGVTVLEVDATSTSSGTGISASGRTYGVNAIAVGAGTGLLASSTNGIAVNGSATTGEAGDFSNNGNANPAVRIQNAGTAFDLALGKLGFNGGPTLPTGVAAGDGAVFYWTAGKNFVDDVAAVGSVAVTGGAGVLVFHVNGSWRTLC